MEGVSIAALLLSTCCAYGQWMLTKEQMIAYTAKSPYERFEDGRPKVPEQSAGAGEGARD